jgi:hypothetical protein
MDTTLQKVIRQLERNNFEVFYAENLQSARDIFETEIVKKLPIVTASYADSITMQKTGALDLLKSVNSIEFIDTFSPDDSTDL